MRCVEKGPAPQAYTHYKDARNDLGTRIGWYCSYCEMPVWNMIEIEHVHPIVNGGDELFWGNFLLCCRYCNGIKSNNNLSRMGYLWPDTDNTIVAFEYSEYEIIEPAFHLPPSIHAIAVATIDLMGLNRAPHSGNEPTDADSRWIARLNALGVIEESFQDWMDCPTAQFARQIARTASGHGFYSFWMKRFSDYPIVLEAINTAFPNTYIPAYDPDGTLMVRITGSY
jgi:hypothetical protein